MTLTDTGEWKPNAYVTRAEFAADLARFAGIHVFYPTDGAAQFSDVDPASGPRALHRLGQRQRDRHRL
ncbi:MAG: hypothetical protein ACLUFI_14800 [Oscillospiraceae bacterium]